jgi:hypothetical protein
MVVTRTGTVASFTASAGVRGSLDVNLQDGTVVPIFKYPYQGIQVTFDFVTVDINTLASRIMHADLDHTNPDGTHIHKEIHLEYTVDDLSGVVSRAAFTTVTV